MSDKNKIVCAIDRHENKLRIEVNGRIAAFIWDITGIDGQRLMRQGKVVGTLNPEMEIQERW